jgi:hypothetical protein
MAKTIIFPEQEVVFNTLFYETYPAILIDPPPFTLVAGETYTVQWGDSVFTTTAISLGDDVPGGVAIGNGEAFGFPGNNEPFIIANWVDGAVLIVSLPIEASQTVSVYQGAEQESASVVLKDRTGTDIEYEGVEGVRVFDKAGNAHVFVPPVETEEKTVELDFSGGAMEVIPTAGKVLSKVDIPVPDGLIPENIAEGIRIAGIDGALKAGGSGGDTLCAFIAFNVDNHRVTNTTAKQTLTTKISLHSQCQIESAYAMYVSGGATYEIAPKDINVGTQRTLPDRSETAASITLSKTIEYTPTSTSLKWMATVMVFATYCVPGMYVRKQGDKTVLYVDSTADVYKLNSYMTPAYEIDTLDFSDAVVETCIYHAAFSCLPVKKVIFPPELPSITGGTFWQSYNWNLPAERIADFSKATSIPSTNGTSNLGSASGLRILVPAALYDKWKTTTNWTAYADCFEAV